ncbi:vitamin-D-receptor interacting mediator subunit 4-domain-containing protein [Cladorrhinum sp. PSN259]|nr:vitamin-D-receptor interacting mediator subunit 4-domain-containing protein [Cladorrhinum sp. PSN259]
MNRNTKPESMGKKLDDRFERLEKSLGAFVDSLAKNNPSEKLCDELIEASGELHGCLKELETHQNNVEKIRKLREETEALDLQTKQIIQNLWDMRKELKSIPTTSYTDSNPKFKFTTQELLSFARRISRNTLPPPGVTNGLDLSSSSSANPRSPTPTNPNNTNNPSAPTPNASTSFAGTPSASTPAATAGTGAPPTPSNANGTPLPQQQQQQQPPPASQQPSSTLPQLPPHLAPQLNPHENAPFFPWPTMEQIRSGALMKCQDLINRGIDPKGYDPEEEERKKKEEEQARKEADERARQERAEHERRVREERERMAQEREAARQAEAVAAGAASAAAGGSISGPSGAGAAAPPGSSSATRPAAKQFTFLDDDDDEDED